MPNRFASVLIFALLCSASAALAQPASAAPSDRPPATAGPWLVLSRLAGQSYYDGDRILRFLPRSDDRFVIFSSILGGGRTNHDVFVLKRTSPNTAVMLNDPDNQAFASITLLPDGWIERPLNENRLGRVNRFKLVGGVLWKNIDVVKDGRVIGTGVEKYRLVSGAIHDAAADTPMANDCPRYGVFRRAFTGPQGGGLEVRAFEISDRCLALWTPQRRQTSAGPSGPAEATLTRFVEGVRSGKPDRDDMSPAMAHEYGNGSSASMPPGGRIPAPKSAWSVVGVDTFGNDVYAVALAGGGASWEIHLDREGRIEAAFFNGRA